MCPEFEADVAGADDPKEKSRGAVGFSSTFGAEATVAAFILVDAVAGAVGNTNVTFSALTTLEVV